VLLERFENLAELENIDDSLLSIAASVSRPVGSFKMNHPSRIVINVDKHIKDNFFVNAELTLPLTPLLGDSRLYVYDQNLLSVTPKYEIRHFGAYLPFTFNFNKQMWIGAALRLGPLLFGMNNMGNIFTKRSIQNGGFYLAFTFRPFNDKMKKVKKVVDGNGERVPANQRGRTDCPKL
jgi:hypothetical protein